MTNAIFIFISGIIGVFFGMTLLYLSIRITALVVDKLETGKEGPK